jgi:SAM-dependent methyltransferase
MKYRPIPPLLLLRRLVRSIERNGLLGTIVKFHKRLFSSLRTHGVRGACERVLWTFGFAARKTPASPNDEIPKEPHPFDLLHHTDTSGYISGAYFSAISLSAFYSTAYDGIRPSAFIQALSELPVQYEDFTFIDIGCGKGRALLVASQFPFRHLRGVEIAGELCDIARANIATRPDWAARISIVHQDATDVVYPDGPILIYLYNPFLAPVLRRVLKNLERQLRRSPRPTYLLYADNEGFTQVMDSFAFLRQISESDYPFSAEDAVFDPAHGTHERFTLYSADLTR